MNNFLGSLMAEQTHLQKISLYVAIFLIVFVLFMCALMPSKKKTASKFARTKLKEILRSCLQLLEDSKQDSRIKKALFKNGL